MNENDLLSPEERESITRTPLSNMEGLFDDCRVDVTDVGTRGNSITIRHFITPGELAKDMRVNPLDIENAMIELSGHYSRYTHLLAKARLQKDDVEARMDLLAAKLDKRIRDDNTVSGVKMTEPNIAAKIKLQTSYINASMAFNEARAVFLVLEGAVSAMDKKYGMLVQLNKNATSDFQKTTSTGGGTVAVESAKERLLAARPLKKSA